LAGYVIERFLLFEFISMVHAEQVFGRIKMFQKYGHIEVTVLPVEVNR